MKNTITASSPLRTYEKEKKMRKINNDYIAIPALLKVEKNALTHIGHFLSENEQGCYLFRKRSDRYVRKSGHAVPKGCFHRSIGISGVRYR